MKLLVLTTSFPRWSGDTEGNFVYELSRRLKESAIVNVLAPHAPGLREHDNWDGILLQRVRYAPERLERLAYDGGILPNVRQHPWLVALIPVFVLTLLIASVRVVRARDIDVIHAHWLFPLGLIGVICKLAMPGRRLRVVCTSHGGDLYGLQGTLWTSVLRWTASRCDELAVVSSAMQVTARDRRIRVDARCMPMGVDARARFNPLEGTLRGSNEILFVGRLVDKKGVVHLVRALEKLAKSYPALRLTIVGSGPEKDRLSLEASRLGVLRRIQFEGRVPQELLPDYYRRATVFVGPSIVTPYGDREGLGLVFAEASACECPVVASNLDEIKDVVIDGETGLLFRSADETDLVAKLKCLLDSPENRTAMGLAGRAYVLRKFDWREVAHEYSALLSGCTNRRERARSRPP